MAPDCLGTADDHLLFKWSSPVHLLLLITSYSPPFHLPLPRCSPPLSALAQAVVAFEGIALVLPIREAMREPAHFHSVMLGCMGAGDDEPLLIVRLIAADCTESSLRTS